LKTVSGSAGQTAIPVPIMITATNDHDAAESVITIERNA
jgi:hypothetical protein